MTFTFIVLKEQNNNQCYRPKVDMGENMEVKTISALLGPSQLS